jgi:hypothetical protein
VLREIAALETEYPQWHVWPSVSYPDNGLMYVKRDNTGMNVIRVQSVASKIGDIARAALVLTHFEHRYIS